MAGQPVTAFGSSTVPSSFSVTVTQGAEHAGHGPGADFASLHAEMGLLIENVQKSLTRMSTVWMLMGDAAQGPARAAAVASAHASADLARSLAGSAMASGGPAVPMLHGAADSATPMPAAPGLSSNVHSGQEWQQELRERLRQHDLLGGLQQQQQQQPQPPPQPGPSSLLMQQLQQQPARRTGAKAMAAIAAAARDIKPDIDRPGQNGQENIQGSVFTSSASSPSEGRLGALPNFGPGPLDRMHFQSAPIRTAMDHRVEPRDVPLPKHPWLDRSHYASEPTRSRAYFQNDIVEESFQEDDTFLPSPQLQQKQSQDQMVWPTVGSAQHASGRCKPCLFWYQGLCHKGQQCLFCHVPHDPEEVSRVRPSKKTRNLLQPTKRK